MLMTARVAAMPAGTTSRTSLTGYRNRNRNRVVVRAAEPSAEPVAKPDVCKTCGLPTSEMPWGCSGDGRVQGGIGAVPGFRWWVMTSTDVRSRAISHSRYARSFARWPIKAYRPCPKAAEKGIEYTRKGQGVDEVMFGRKE